MNRRIYLAVIAIASIAVASLFATLGSGPSLDTVRELQTAGRYQESLDPLRELLRDDPDHPEVHYRYGLALRRTGQPDLAIWSLRKARRSDDWSVPAGTELTQAALASQDWTTAIEAAPMARYFVVPSVIL